MRVLLVKKKKIGGSVSGQSAFVLPIFRCKCCYDRMQVSPLTCIVF